MKKPVLIGIIAFVLLGLGVGGYFKFVKKPVQKPVVQEDVVEDTVEPADPSISLTLTKHPSKANTMILTVDGLKKEYATIAYELSYDSAGTSQGVISKALDVSNLESFTRDDIYLGTCSRNVCRPHPDVGAITAIVELTKPNGKVSQLSKEFK